MDCPVDGTQLLISERAGVEIDYCPRCRGVWLDRGELDKILDRSRGERTSGSRDHDDRRPRDDYRRDQSDDRRYADRDDSHRSKKKKNKLGDFLDDIFDF